MQIRLNHVWKRPEMLKSARITSSVSVPIVGTERNDYIIYHLFGMVFEKHNEKKSLCEKSNKLQLIFRGEH